MALNTSQSTNATEPTSNSMASAKRTQFTAEALGEFFKSGWVLTLDAQRVLVGWGEWSLSDKPSTDPETCWLYTPDFYRELAKPWRFTRAWDVLDRQHFATHVLAGVTRNVNANEQGFQWLEPVLGELEERSWREIQKGFSERGLRKAVPVVFARAQGRVSIESILKRLVAEPPQLMPYGFWDGEEGVIGATPEVLFAAGQDFNAIETMALAGTRAKDDGLAPFQLMADAKERYEHQLVVDDLKEQLSRLGDVVIGPTQVMELPSLYHLHTRVQARPKKKFTPLDMIECLHPTPALGVAPRRLGFSEMRRWDDPHRRRRFGAPFAAVWPEGMHCVVAIRNIEWNGSHIQLGSGCGVVPESVLEREWKELKLKRDSVRRMLGV